MKLYFPTIQHFDRWFFKHGTFGALNGLVLYAIASDLLSSGLTFRGASTAGLVGATLWLGYLLLNSERSEK